MRRIEYIIPFPLSRDDQDQLPVILNDIRQECSTESETSESPITRQTLLNAWFPEVPPEEISVLGQNTTPAAYPLDGGGASYADSSTLGTFPPNVTCLFAPIAQQQTTISIPNADSVSAEHAQILPSETSQTSTKQTNWQMIKRAAEQIASKAQKKSKNWPMSAIDQFPEQMSQYLAGTQVDDIVISLDDVDNFANS